MNIKPNAASYQTTGTNSAPAQSSAGSFQVAVDPVKAGNQGVAASASSSLEAQTSSALLQLQDLNQAHGGGGGGGHHGAMKLTNNLEAEEAAESEEAQNLNPRKRLGKLVTRDGVTEADETEETADADETESSRQKDHPDSLT